MCGGMVGWLVTATFSLVPLPPTPEPCSFRCWLPLTRLQASDMPVCGMSEYSACLELLPLLPGVAVLGPGLTALASPVWAPPLTELALSPLQFSLFPG